MPSVDTGCDDAKSNNLQENTSLSGLELSCCVGTEYDITYLIWVIGHGTIRWVAGGNVRKYLGENDG